MFASKLIRGPFVSFLEFHPNLVKWFSTHGETWKWNQRHGSIIHSYYKNTASKTPCQIPISVGYAFSSSSHISQTFIHRVHKKHKHTDEALRFKSSHLVSLMSSGKIHIVD